ncbi:hypothetical protein [Streptomyces malaysiensis]|uniref:hypothetical protein n=1 Tax=Streptomyces malaysiensis TaxID=92644 RepID=UPI003440DCE2
MSIDQQPQLGDGTRNRLVMLAALVAAAALGAAAFAVFTHGSGADKGGSGDQQHSQSPDAFSLPPTQGTTEPTVLPSAKSAKDGVPVGYPRTLNGAISAAAHFYDIIDAFNPVAAEKQYRVTAEPGKEKQLGDDALRFSMALRNSSGLSLVGESDAGNYYTLHSRAYRIDSASKDRVRVWILTDTELSARGVADSDTTVQTADLVWAAGDWKFTSLDEKGSEPDPVAPDSAQAVNAGWRTLAYAK